MSGRDQDVFKEPIKALKKKKDTKVDPFGKQMYLIFPTILFDAYLV